LRSTNLSTQYTTIGLADIVARMGYLLLAKCGDIVAKEGFEVNGLSIVREVDKAQEIFSRQVGNIYLYDTTMLRLTGL